MSVRFPSPALLLATSLALALAGCDALLPVTSTPIPEQPNYGKLPGPGTYAVVAATDVPSAPEAATPSAASPAESADTAPAATAPTATPPVNDADGSATGFLATRTGADTLGTAPMPADDAAAVQAALARAIERRGYRARPVEQAAWRMSYSATVENREENLAPRDKMLIPRMRCDLQNCIVQHQWEHFGPPLRGEGLRRYQVGIVNVQIHNARNGELVWQGRLSSELDETGELNANELQRAVARMMKKLPRAPKQNPLPEPVQGNASRQ